MLGVPAFSALLTVMLVLLSFANHSYRVHALCRPSATKTHPNRVAANSCSDLNCASAQDPAWERKGPRTIQADSGLSFEIRHAPSRNGEASVCGTTSICQGESTGP